MGSTDIEAINSSSVIHIGYELAMKEEPLPNVDEAAIFRVPKLLRKSDYLYSPQFVSIGPFHYGKGDLKELEKSKSEAVRRMETRIQRNCSAASIKSFVENDLLPKDKEIRKFYGEHIPFTSIELAWIVTRDACFMYEFLVNYLSRNRAAADFYQNEVKAFSWQYDAVFDVRYQNPMREGLMTDILLLENQIPLWVLKDVLQVRMGSPEAADKEMQDFFLFLLPCVNRQNLFMWNVQCSYNTCSHLLEALYINMLGKNVDRYSYREALQSPPSLNRLQIYFKKGVDLMNPVCGRWCKLRSNKDPGSAQQTPSSPHNCMEVWFKKGVDSMKAIYKRWREMCTSSESRGQTVRLKFVKLSTASELIRAGVKIRPVTEEDIEVNCAPAIRWIRFDDKTATLYLPQIMVTPELYSIMSNFIMMEVSIRSYSPNPMTQYILFMDELIDSVDDVAVLRKKQVIHNFLGSNQEVADLFNALGTGIIPDQGCKLIDEARKGLYIYMKRKYKILWSEFKSAYFSKPWLVAGSIVAVLLLMMTVSQVLCLFVSCNP